MDPRQLRFRGANRGAICIEVTGQSAEQRWAQENTEKQTVSAQEKNLFRKVLITITIVTRDTTKKNFKTQRM